MTGLAVTALLAGLLSGCGAATPAPAPAAVSSLDPALHDLLPARVRQRGVLRVGTDASYAPMSSFGPDGRRIVGAEPDLGAALGTVLGVRLEFVVTGFTDLMPALASTDLDLVMSAMTDTRQRERRADFVNYFSAGTAIVVQRGNPAGVTDLADLCGREVAVERGTTQVDLLRRTQQNCTGAPISLRTYDTNSDALMQLRTGRAVAVLNDLPPAVYLVTDPRTSSQYQLASTTQYEPGLYGIAVAKDQPGLRDAVRGAFEQLLASGAYDDILEHWKVQQGRLDRISVNSAR